MFKHYAIKSTHLAEAREIVAGFAGRTLAVHFRGSDKVAEAPRVPLEAVLDATHSALEYFNAESLFIASDEKEVLAAMRATFGRRNVYSLECAHLSDGRTGAHFLGGDPLQLGREAILTMLIISMCCACVRGCSHLSAWAKIFSPELPIVMLNKPRSDAAVFPEGEIYEHSLHRITQ
jgi:hypothetical protein